MSEPDAVIGWLIFGASGGYGADGQLHSEDPLAIAIHLNLNELGVSKYNSGGGSCNLYGRLKAYIEQKG